MIVAVVPKKGSKSSRREWKLADEVVEDKKKRKQRVHREEMVQYRQRKKIQGSELRAEHRNLQRNIERHVAEWKIEAAKCTARTRLPLGADSNEVAILQNQVRELVLQAEALRVENATLQGAVAGYVQLQGVVYAESDRLAQVCAGSVLGGAGWRVNFANGEPSFHYYPFSETECDAIVQTYDGRMNGEELMGCGGFTQVGTLLGWSVERTPLAFHDNLKWMETRVKFTKRIQCVAGAAGATMSKLEAESWSVLTTPELYARVHRATCTSLKLQEINDDTVIIVSNSPSQSSGRHLRHLMLIHRRSTVDEAARRALTFAMVVPDSKPNKRSREAEGSRDKVLWICEGASYMTLKQIDDSTLEATYDNCSGCKNELHAHHLLVEWGHEALRWEQLVTPSKLLAM